MSATRSWRAWSSTVRLVLADVADADAATADAAAAELADLLDQVDRAVSRFRADSELSRANARCGRPTPVSPMCAEFVEVALRAAATTDGAVDPTVGRLLSELGYDRDIAEVKAGSALAAVPVRVPVRTWRHVRLEPAIGALTVPAGTALDLGATAKAHTADLAARQLARRYGSVLVELGGDVAVGGRHTWPVRTAERAGGDGPVVLLPSGGLATSTTTLRRWRRGSSTAHHVVDPRTGLPTAGPWRTATVHADTACGANAASTAALVLGEAAVGWLEQRRLAARLVDQDGRIRTTSGWPAGTAVAA